jgi:hypothetical protein
MRAELLACQCPEEDGRSRLSVHARKGMQTHIDWLRAPDRIDDLLGEAEEQG